jgi:cytochrome c oxidase assembly factor CtaG
MVPGGFLTFSDHPLYGVYELAPRVGGSDATVDQHLAGVLMKIGNLPLLWPAIGLLFARWARQSASATPVASATRRHSL